MAYGPSSLHVPRPSEIRERFQPVGGTSGTILAAWTVSAFLAFLVPISKWAVERNRYHNYYGRYNEYEYQQRQYEEGNNNNNGNYNQNGNGGYYRLCRWWDFSCRYKMGRYQNMYNNGQGGEGGQEQAQMRAMLPGWYFFFGGSVENEDREREEMGMGQNEGSMKFVYFCTIAMFVGLAVFGFKSMYAGKDRMGVIVALLIFGMFSLLNLLTTVQGTIETDNRFFEDSIYGWFGQWSVLVAYTDFWLMLFCFAFAFLLGMMRCLDRKATRAAAVHDVSVNAPASSYNLESGIQPKAVEMDPVQSNRSYYAPE